MSTPRFVWLVVQYDVTNVCDEIIAVLRCCVLPVSKVGRSLLQGNSVTVDGCCCVCSSCCAKEYPVVLGMTTVQNKITKKLSISFFPVLINILEILIYL